MNYLSNDESCILVQDTYNVISFEFVYCTGLKTFDGKIHVLMYNS